jgi:hypothetical protein
MAIPQQAEHTETAVPSRKLPTPIPGGNGGDSFGLRVLLFQAESKAKPPESWAAQPERVTTADSTLESKPASSQTEAGASNISDPLIPPETTDQVNAWSSRPGIHSPSRTETVR